MTVVPDGFESETGQRPTVVVIILTVMAAAGFLMALSIDVVSSDIDHICAVTTNERDIVDE